VIAALILGGIAALAAALPLVVKWELGVRRSMLGVAACAIASGLAVAALSATVDLDPLPAGLLVTVAALAASVAVLLWRFYRDPERSAPQREGTVVSPADGLVIYVHRFEHGELPISTKRGRHYVLDELVRTPLRSEDAVVVGIALSFLDVHVNRAPIAGAVTAQERYPGPFRSLKDPSAVFANERATTVLERGGLQVAVVLIASRLVRRIVSFVRQGDQVALGQRIGAIRFGSQVDVVLPDAENIGIRVSPGDRVRAGETVIAEVTR
jgi:phosphatidylserine decarboxylase